MLPRIHTVLMIATLASLGLLPACSDDDDTITRPAGDTMAPIVVGIVPANGASNVAISTPVTITFNEAMDPDSADGAVTLSSGDITSAVWTDSRTLVISHADWPQGSSVTVTIGTGLTDAAGNALAAPQTVTFYTAAAALVFIASNPADGAVEVNRSASIQLLFSASMNLTSLETAVTIADDRKELVPFTVLPGAGDWVVLDPTGDLAGSSEITVTVSTEARDESARNLAEPAEFSFTTGDDIDNEPPTIIGFVPANGAVVPANTDYLQITFNEAVDPGSLNPTRINAELQYLVHDSEGYWSADFTVLTFPLPTPLPAGLPLDVTFAGYADFAGNIQTAATHWQATVAGAADYYPLVDGRRYEYFVNEAGGSIGSGPDWVDTFIEHIQFNEQAGDIFFRAYYNAGYTETHDWDILRKSASGLELLGFHEGPDPVDIIFDSPLTYVRMPLAVGTWTDQTTATVDEEVMTLAGSGTVVEQVDLPWIPAGSNNPEVFWKNVWLVVIEHDVSVGSSLYEAGVDSLWLAPTFGIVKYSYYNENYEDDEWNHETGELASPYQR